MSGDSSASKPVNASWQLTAEVKPKADAPPESTSKSPPEVVAPAWADAAEGVRATVKWLVAGLAAVGAVMFAKGFVTTPELSWDDNRWQLVGAWVMGAIGVMGIGWLLYSAVDMIRPTPYALSELDKKFIRHVNDDPRAHLPADAADIRAFIDNLREKQVIARSARLDRNGWKVRLDKARAASSADPADATAKAKVGAVQHALNRADALVEWADGDLSIYLKARKELLGHAEYWRQSTSLDGKRWMLLGGAFLAAAGGIGYQLLLAAPSDDDSGGSAATPVVGELTRSDTEAGRRLWSQLHLDLCQEDPTTARIAVVVGSGKGTAADPYVVSTLPTGACIAQTFTVISDVAQVSLPVASTITYTPAPTTSPAPE